MTVETYKRKFEKEGYPLVVVKAIEKGATLETAILAYHLNKRNG